MSLSKTEVKIKEGKKFKSLKNKYRIRKHHLVILT